MNIRLQIPHFQQSAEGYCLPACVRMVLAYWGLQRSETAIRRILGTRAFGTPTFAVEHLRQWDVQIIYREWTVPQLLTALEMGQPVILFLRTGFLDHWQQDVAHAVVLVDYEENQRFWLHDPALSTGPVAVSWNGVLAAWAEFGYRGAALSYGQGKSDDER